MSDLVAGFSPFGTMYGDLGPWEEMFKKKKDISQGFEGIDCLFLWGGTDVHPSYYREKPHGTNGAPAEPSRRDIMEWKAMLYCKAHNIPMVGVCRGAQYLCVFNGGSLAQDVTGHGFDHYVMTKDGKSIFITSTHHQMMNPFSIPHEMIAWSEKPKSKHYLNGDGKSIQLMEENEEPEIVFFPQTRALAIQGHPEYLNATPLFKRYCRELVAEYLFKEEMSK